MPFALVEKHKGALRLAALSKSALGFGLHLAMPLANARALVPHLQVEGIDPEADRVFLLSLASACERFTPLVARDGQEGLTLDITGCAHLFGGERALYAHILERFARFGLSLRAAIASTPDAAQAFARFSDDALIPPDQEEEMARLLPVTALGMDEATMRALIRAGLKTLGDLATRPSVLLAARFGVDLTLKLQRILGHEDIRLTPLRPLPDTMAEMHFPEPLTVAESLIATFEHLIGDIVHLLEQRGHGGRVFEASFFRSDGLVRRLLLETASPQREAASLVRLLRLKIESLSDPLDPGFGFDALRLAVITSEPLAMQQRDFESSPEKNPQDGAVAALVDRLVARFGRDRVLRSIALDSHAPQRASLTTPYLSGAAISGAATIAWPQPEPGQPPTRPLHLFEPPYLIEALAEVPDGPPLRFRWQGRLHDIARAEGPERIAPEWWRAGARPPATRDYYRVENQSGHRFWLYRDGLYEEETQRPRWFLHGLFA